MQIPCIIEYQEGENDDYFLIGPTQSLVLRWDQNDPLKTETLAALETLPNFKLEAEGHYFLEIEPRSMLGTMYFLSHGIEVPLKHAAAGLVTTTTGPYGEPFSWFDVTGDLLHVRSQKRKPKCAAVAVKYRDHWFYIDDQNLESKSTFALLLQLFELQHLHLQDFGL